MGKQLSQMNNADFARTVIIWDFHCIQITLGDGYWSLLERHLCFRRVCKISKSSY